MVAQLEHSTLDNVSEAFRNSRQVLEWRGRKAASYVVPPATDMTVDED